MNRCILCEFCEKTFDKKESEIKRSKHNFCSSSCSAYFNNRERALIVEIKKVNCKYCNISFVIKKTSVKKVCNVCIKKNKDAYNNSYIKESKCVLCDEIIFSRDGKKSIVNYVIKSFVKISEKELVNYQQQNKFVVLKMKFF